MLCKYVQNQISELNEVSRQFLHHIGGINDNSFIRVLDPDVDDNNKLNCPQIISHSSYYDSKKIFTKLQTCKNKFTILV